MPTRCLPHLAVAAVSLLFGGLSGSFLMAAKLFLSWYIGMADLISLWVGCEKLSDGSSYWRDNLWISLALTIALVLLWR